MMKSLLLFFTLLISCAGHASEYAVVVSKEVDISPIEKEKIKDVFLKKRRTSNGVRLIPVNIVGNLESRIAFETRVLQMDRDEINQYWIKSHFQGISPPTTQGSNSSLKLFIERVKGSIGYLPIDMVDDSLKVLYEF